MKIAQIAPIIESVPPKKYGGTERVVYALTEELVKRGHDVTLFASGDSQTSAKLVSVFPRSLREAKVKDLYGLNEMPLYNFALAYEHQDEFDVIHDHNGYISLPTANVATTPLIMSIHGPFTSNQKHMFRTLNKPYVVSISKAQLPFPGTINHLTTVHHGLEMKHYPFSPTHDGYLLFVGRMSQEKGVHNAIQVAQSLNMRLLIAAKLDTIDKKHFYENVEPYIDNDKIKWIGEVNETERNDLMSKALCLLHPIEFREPFGLTLIEAMACGCPVVAFNRGSIPEIIEDGKTGYVVSDVEEMSDAVSFINSIKREDCRKRALEYFSVERMADDYEKVYRQVVQLQNRTEERYRMINRPQSSIMSS